MFCKFIILFLLYTTSVDSLHFRADYNYSQKAKGWMKLHQVPATWQDARIRCNAEGAVLASPLNGDLQYAMMNMVAADSLATHRGVFSGVHATFYSGDYFSLEGAPLSQMTVFWALDQPDNVDNSENCLIFFYNGSMADVKCSNTYKYICYKKEAEMMINECGTADDEYKLDTRTGSCYKFHRHGLTWARAFMTCTAEGGHLAIINSETEAQVLRDIFAKYPQNTLSSPYKDSANIGFHDWGDHGTWFTIHGQTLEEAGYAKWSGGQPDNAVSGGVGEYCGSIFRTGLLDDIWCHVLAAFICEKHPNSLREKQGFQSNDVLLSN